MGGRAGRADRCAAHRTWWHGRRRRTLRTSLWRHRPAGWWSPGPARCRRTRTAGRHAATRGHRRSAGTASAWDGFGWHAASGGRRRRDRAGPGRLGSGRPAARSGRSRGNAHRRRRSTRRVRAARRVRTARLGQSGRLVRTTLGAATRRLRRRSLRVPALTEPGAGTERRQRRSEARLVASRRERRGDLLGGLRALGGRGGAVGHVRHARDVHAGSGHVGQRATTPRHRRLAAGVVIGGLRGGRWRRSPRHPAGVGVAGAAEAEPAAGAARIRPGIRAATGIGGAAATGATARRTTARLTTARRTTAPWAAAHPTAGSRPTRRGPATCWPTTHRAAGDLAAAGLTAAESPPGGTALGRRRAQRFADPAGPQPGRAGPQATGQSGHRVAGGGALVVSPLGILGSFVVATTAPATARRRRDTAIAATGRRGHARSSPVCSGARVSSGAPVCSGVV